MTQIQLTRQLIVNQLRNNQVGFIEIDKYDWWLLGTSSCHLCEDAEKILSLFSKVQPISYQKVDIAYLNEALMMQFATKIPVIITQTVQLNYPFSVLDLQSLVS